MKKPEIKICGLFRQEDAAAVNRAMPDYAGFVFYKNSRRNVSMEQSKRLRDAIDPRIRTVGVFVNAPQESIEEIYRQNIISIVQLHGNEDETYLSELRKRLPGAVIWQAFRIRTEADIRNALRSTADAVMLDNGHGTGECFDWSLIKDFDRPFILAGGLTPQTLCDALGRFFPSILDISSGVETDGVKDAQKILVAVQAVRTMNIKQ